MQVNLLPSATQRQSANSYEDYNVTSQSSIADLLLRLQCLLSSTIVWSMYRTHCLCVSGYHLRICLHTAACDDLTLLTDAAAWRVKPHCTWYWCSTMYTALSVKTIVDGKDYIILQRNGQSSCHLYLVPLTLTYCDLLNGWRVPGSGKENDTHSTCV